jgi:hypothetical protein
MILTVYAQAVGPRTIQLWVGMFGTEAPPNPRFVINRQPAQPDVVVAPMTAIRDKQAGPGGQPVNHRGIFRFAVMDAGQPHKVEVQAGIERQGLATSTLPEEIPEALQGSFNLLICSCYFQPEDSHGLLGTIVSQIQLQPHLTLLAGDQVYMDLPLLEDLPESEPELSRLLGGKYLRNWASAALRVPGLEPVLRRAPVVNLPDDHEFWNNYPFPQKQLPNTWDKPERDRWEAAAQALYEDYQLATDPAQAGATRLDVRPLKMLFVDMRCARDGKFQTLMKPTALAALEEWKQDLLHDKAAGLPVVGLLSSGQALFIDPPRDESKKRDVDAEMGNYTEFALVEDLLGELADHGVPVIYVTGDVHWGRVASADDRRNPGRKLLYEVIASPSRLIRVPLLDTFKESGNVFKGLFGNKDPWPRHSDPDTPPDYFGGKGRFALHTEAKRRGDHVAVISFTRAGNGLDFRVSFFGIHADKSISKSETAGPYKLRAI